ncbi:hypothetical protein OIU85_029848 [Salix viminalis]|uniref:Uncharacterized protein n=1 Tax=Salix viminalis TaxID=40686 RepID=A0A9Q0QC97_SALVM|nr:hypothetical protein OIU85_029848 [Salix viminalis]
MLYEKEGYRYTGYQSCCYIYENRSTHHLKRRHIELAAKELRKDKGEDSPDVPTLVMLPPAFLSGRKSVLLLDPVMKTDKYQEKWMLIDSLRYSGEENRSSSS